jgi:TetR/AcrR family transcriptional regulator
MDHERGTRSRRSPGPGERRRDPERTRERILEAAAIEFGEHGYAGARISAIARRAGVNQQLISYYFDGKAGLYKALSDRWRSISADLNQARMPMSEVAGNFLHASREYRPWARLLAWQGLTDDEEPDEAADAFFAAMVDDVRRRQEAGEFAADLDPAYLLLVFFAAGMAPTILPQVVRRMTGLAADSDEFLDTFQEQLSRILAHLR